MIGEWIVLKYNEETENNEFKTIKVTEDGKLIIDEKEYKIKFSTHGHHEENYGAAYDADGNDIYGVHTRYNEDYHHTLEFIVFSDDEYHTYRSMSEYTIIEITEENWQDYFSTNFNENFEESLSLYVNKNTWGEITDGGIDRTFYLKGYEKYGYDTELDIEYSYEYGNVYCEFDVDNETVTKCDFTSNSEEERVETISMNFNSWGSPEDLNMKSGGFYLSKEEILAGNVQRSWCSNPKKILRMKGWLVIKNDT
jgi:hypothetical protein